MIPRIAIRLILLCWLIAALGFQTWRRGEVIRVDVSSYYSYLPAVFIRHDLSFSYLKKEDRFDIWYEVLPDGRRYERMTVGLSFLYLPFFLLAHGVAQFTGYSADGYSMPYALALALSGLFYAGWGLWFVAKILRRWFAPRVIALTLYAIALGTNLFFYVSMAGAYSHAFSFFLFAVFCHLYLKWHDQSSLKITALAGIIFGLIVLIRPTNIALILVPILHGWYCRKKTGWGTGMQHIALFSVCAAIVFLPQCLYWKYATGQWVLYSYGSERFFFGHPHIVDALFGYRKGWLLYTPIMLFAIFGLLRLPERLREWSIALPVYLIVHLYVMSSWWIWWYGGSFGQRPMVETYAVLVIPLAVCIEWALVQNRLKKALFIGLFAGCILLNCFQTVQMRLGILHWDAMTKTAYWHIFLRLSRPEDLDQLLQPPDLERAYKGY